MPIVYFNRAVSPNNERRRWSKTPDDLLQRLDGDLSCMQVLEEKNEWPTARNASQSSCQELEDMSSVFGPQCSDLSELRITTGCGANFADFRKHRKK